MLEDKIKTLKGLQETIDRLKREGKRVVHCHGCFDLLHYGHLKHFQSARGEGDVLVVTLTPDRFINKGPGRPYFNEHIRQEMIAALECVDFVALNEWPTAIETIRAIKPDVYVKGKEVLGNQDIDAVRKESGEAVSNLTLEEIAVKSVGGRLYLTDEVTFSSSRMLNEIASSLPEDARTFLRELKEHYSAEQVLSPLESLKNIKVLVIGDPIIDEYVYCASMDKSGKEPLVSYKHSNSEMHAGGIFAVSNHLAGFAERVGLISCFGNGNRHVIDSGLNQSIQSTLFSQKDLEGIVKRRYIEDYRRVKLFEVYNTNDLNIDKETERKVLDYLDGNLDFFDMVVVADFGHGMITPAIRAYLENSGKFLAVNAQLNGGNMGYNFITKYQRADFVSINEKELRLPFQDKTGDITGPIQKLREHLGADKISITLGKKGLVYYDKGEYFYVPSLTRSPIDTIGAGDAVLSIGSLLAYKDVDARVASFLGNSVGALAVQIVGNRNAVDPFELKKFVSYMMR